MNSNRCVIETLQVVPYGIQELNLSSHQRNHKMHVICVEHPFICLSLKPGDKKLQLLKLQASEDVYLIRFSTTGQIEIYFIAIAIRFLKKFSKFKICLAPMPACGLVSILVVALSLYLGCAVSNPVEDCFFMLSLP